MEMKGAYVKASWLELRARFDVSMNLPPPRPCASRTTERLLKLWNFIYWNVSPWIGAL